MREKIFGMESKIEERNTRDIFKAIANLSIFRTIATGKKNTEALETLNKNIDTCVYEFLCSLSERRYRTICEIYDIMWEE